MMLLGKERERNECMRYSCQLHHIWTASFSRHDRIVFSGVSFFGRMETRRGNAHESN